MTATLQPDPALLFCLGANKAGTSWLYDYLAGHPECRVPVVKELHYFDARFFKRFGMERRRIKELRTAAIHALEYADLGTAMQLRAELDELDEWLAVITGAVEARRGDEAYRKFLLGRADGQTKLVADITPSYALMPRRILQLMQGMAEKVRFLYILRDPVDRLWSNLRMNATRLAGSTGAVADEAFRQFDLWAEGKANAVQARSDYAGTLTRLTQTVDPSNLCVMFYENMFTPSAINRLCDFLGIASHPANFSKMVHLGVPVFLDASRRARAREILAPQYEYVDQSIGNLPIRWRENMDEMVK